MNLIFKNMYKLIIEDDKGHPIMQYDSAKLIEVNEIFYFGGETRYKALTIQRIITQKSSDNPNDDNSIIEEYFKVIAKSF